MRLLILVGIFCVVTMHLDGQNLDFAKERSYQFARMVQEKLGLSEEKMCAIQLIVEDTLSEALKEREGKRIRNRQFMIALEPIFIPQIKAILNEGENVVFDSVLYKIEQQRITIQNRRKKILLKKGAKKKKQNSDPEK